VNRGEWVRPKTARNVVEAKERLARERMREAGVEPKGRGSAIVSYELYDLLIREVAWAVRGRPRRVPLD
jgi:hypothetical protein